MGWLADESLMGFFFFDVELIGPDLAFEGV